MREDGWPKDGSVDQVYQAWFERPRWARVERYEPPDHLVEISGSTESHYWQYFPRQRQGRALRHQEPPRDADTWEHLMTFTHEAVPAELLDPWELWQVEGTNTGASVTVVGHMEHLGRASLQVHATPTERNERGDWTELLWPADDYEFVVDEATGILLRASCLFQGKEFAVAEVFDLSLDQQSGRSLFEYRPPPGTATTPGAD